MSHFGNVDLGDVIFTQIDDTIKDSERCQGIDAYLLMESHNVATTFLSSVGNPDDARELEPWI